MEDAILRRTWAEIDLDALEHNYKVARTRIGDGVKYLGVVKADAYGHGAIQVSRKLEQLGADYLAVSSLDEARELRHGGITMPILILGHTPPEMVPQLISYHITQAVSAMAKAEEYSAEAQKCGGTLRVHIKVDTGMSRLGFLVRGEHFESGVKFTRRYIRGKNVVLLDDVLTTGESFRQLQRKMKQLGALSVIGVFLGKTV